MGPGGAGPEGCCGRLAFNWRRRRNAWRLGVFFQALAAAALLGNGLNLLVYLLISQRSFFTNYRCGEAALRFIAAAFVSLMAVTGTAGLCALLLCRVLLLFNDFPVSEFMALGPWTSRLGCVVKWLPLFVAACFLAWFAILLLSTAWIFLLPEDWCSRRWSFAGVAAVSNCRLWFRGEAKCIDAQEKERLDAEMVNVCNDGEELASLNFFWFSPKEEGGSCSVGDVSVCMAYKNLFSTLSAAAAAAKVDWSSSALAACRGPQAAGLAPEAFMLSSDDSSDLYRYLLMFCICWNITFLTLTLFFFYIKYSSKMDSIFFLPKRPKENLLLKIFRPFSPFTR